MPPPLGAAAHGTAYRTVPHALGAVASKLIMQHVPNCLLPAVAAAAHAAQATQRLDWRHTRLPPPFFWLLPLLPVPPLRVFVSRVAAAFWPLRLCCHDCCRHQQSLLSQRAPAHSRVCTCPMPPSPLAQYCRAHTQAAEAAPAMKSAMETATALTSAAVRGRHPSRASCQ